MVVTVYNQRRKKSAVFSDKCQDIPASQGYRCGRDDLLGDNLQRVHHRDISQTSGDRQSGVSAL